MYVAAVIPQLKFVCDEAAWRWRACCQRWFGRGLSAANSMIA